MLELEPIDARVVTGDHAAAVVAPAYDALSAEQRATWVAEQPATFLGCLPTGTTTTEGLAANRRCLERLVATGRFGPLQRDLLLVLELTDAGRTVTAVLGDVDVAAYLDGRIRPHEHVRPDRVAELARYLDSVEVASSPVCVLHEPSDPLAAAVAAVREGPPLLDVSLPDGARIRLWRTEQPAARAALQAGVRHLAACTVADGHHRAAAVAHRLGPTAGAQPQRADPPDPARRVLTAFVPADQLAIAAFHRRIDGLGEVRAEDLLALLATLGLDAAPLPGSQVPTSTGDVHLTVDGRWWRVHLGDRPGPGAAGHLDASIADRVLVPAIATLAEGPTPARVVPVAAPLGLTALERYGAIGLALAPATMTDLLVVTGAGEVLPHKSTYLAPKLRSGVLVVPR
ncbi:MAG: DUF1015 family protein [Nitriliruptoraceae bacterium]